MHQIPRREVLALLGAAALAAGASAGRLLGGRPLGDRGLGARALGGRGLGGTALASGRSEPAPSGKSRKMTLDLSCGSIGVSASLREAFDLARRHGFESITLSAEEIQALPQAERDRLTSEMRSSGVAPGAAGLSVDFRGEESRFEDGLKRLGGQAEALERFGATRVGTWIAPGHGSLTYRKNFDQHASRLRRVAEILDGHKLRLGLEYVGPKTSWSRARFPFIHTLAEMRELIAAIAMKNVGLVLDSWHWYTARDTEADLLSLASQDIVAVDLNDAPAGKGVDEQIDSSRELPCATGVIDVATFLNALNRVGYDGPVRAEPFNAELRKLPKEEAVAATAKAMKKAFAMIR